VTPDSQSVERLQPRATVILIIEDEFLVRLSVAAYLRDSGYTVIEVSNASEALIVIASQTHIDLVFSDIRIPGWMDGEVLANWLSIRRPEIPVILTSGVITPPLKYKTNAFRFIPKPYVLANVEKAIRELLDKALGATGASN
jgi:two-component system, response regulator PdtaR